MPEFDDTPDNNPPLPYGNGGFDMHGPLPPDVDAMQASNMDYHPGRLPSEAHEGQPADAAPVSAPTASREKPWQEVGAGVIHRRFDGFHTSDVVEGVVKYMRGKREISHKEPLAKVAAYLEFMADPTYGNDPIMTGYQRGLAAEVEKHVMQADDVPDSHFALHQRLARQEGHGNIEITPPLRAEMARIIAGDQRASLSRWAEYVASNDAMLAPWFRRFAFDSVTMMGKFNPERGKYGAYANRTQSTVLPYPELSRGALSRVHTWMQGHLAHGATPEVIAAGLPEALFDDDRRADFKRALERDDFAALYAHALHAGKEGRITDEDRARTTGEWRTYVQNSDPGQLHADLQGYRLDWCTATGFETTVTHIAGGDFHVYYTADEGGRNIVPRVAVRMQGGEVAEVRGINPEQELEPVLADIVRTHVEPLPGGIDYARKAADMKRVTAIERLLKADADTVLPIREVRFMYEVDRPILGFGFESDPRIKELQAVREGRDMETIERLIPDVVREQLQGAMQAYDGAMMILRSPRLWHSFGSVPHEHCTAAEMRSMFERTHREWEKNGVYKYAAQQLVQHGVRHWLVATPNVPITLVQLRALRENFPYEQRYSYPHFDVPSVNAYLDEQVAGSKGPYPVRFSLVAQDSQPDWEADAHDQRLRLYAAQTVNPGLNLHVPSMLDVMMMSYINGGQGAVVFDQQKGYFVRHFDLTPYAGRIGPALPVSGIVNAKPTLSFATPGGIDNAVLAVG